jgi:hypothetical protein
MWSLDTVQHTLAPGMYFTLKVTLYLYDRGRHRDNIIINVKNNQKLYVPVYGVGVGTSIVLVPNIRPTYDLGTLYRSVYTPIHIHVQLYM